MFIDVLPDFMLSIRQPAGDDMAGKVEVDDISKLRPELLDMSVAELERRRAEIDMAIAKKAEIEAEARLKADIELAGTAFDNMIEAMQVLHGLGRLPERIKNVVTSSDGSFQPGRYLKKPRT
jgi:hypothetical protein